MFCYFLIKAKQLYLILKSIKIFTRALVQCSHALVLLPLCADAPRTALFITKHKRVVIIR